MLPSSVKIWLATDPADMRRGHDGLMALAKTKLGLDPYAGHLVVFFGRRRDRCKIVFFDRGGFVLYYKRLEKGRFSLPKIPSGASSSVVLDATELAMLLDGIDVARVRRPVLWEPKKVGPSEGGSTARSRSDLTSSWPRANRRTKHSSRSSRRRSRS